MRGVLFFLLLFPGSAWPQQDLQSWIAGRHFVFVAGIYAEGSRDEYFRHSVLGLRSVGKPASVQLVFPASEYSIEANARLLGEQWRQGGRKHQVIIAHSKGGVEVVLSALENPDLIESGVIDQVVVVQSPLYGLPIAQWSPRLGKKFLGLGSLSPMHLNQGFWNGKTKHLFQDRLDRLSRHIHFVTSSKKGRVAPGIRWIRQWMNWVYPGIPNDGLILEEDQKLSQIGHHLGHWEADHLDLIADQRASSSSAETKQQFIRWVLLRLSVQRSLSR